MHVYKVKCAKRPCSISTGVHPHCTIQLPSHDSLPPPSLNHPQQTTTQVDDPVVILGFGPQGQMVANMLSSPLGAGGQAYVGFDLEPQRVNAGRQAGFRVQYGDGARSDVLKAAGV